MEKQIARVSYWLGIACLVVAIGWRAGNAAGLWLPPTPAVAPGRTVSYWSFYHGTMLFFATSVATTCYGWLNSQKT
jgi:hypothetical protein